MTVHHRLLCRVQITLVSESFDSYQLPAFELSQRHDAGVGGTQSRLTPGLITHHHGTGAAIPGRTALLCPGEPLTAHILKHSQISRWIDVDVDAVQSEFQFLTIWTGFR